MGLLDRLRSWFGAVFGDAGADEESAEEEAEPRLDPGNVTEVRKEPDEDPAAKLSDVREKHTSEDDDAG